METRVIEVPVICARCRKRKQTLPLTVRGAADPLPVYGVCPACRTSPSPRVATVKPRAETDAA
ncbi:MAG: hypothetical protein AVDCRST_MAG42-2130 [uncultured Chthoniobacterales bacterium]|uniref:Uncharacterized protein n=1 Tax=uncultured Chthoniobacterales bacterium TaxID=1836801 RepID=A0A6J4I8B3_9BACT|nr:MAG: hypothetical protein AVDCRST_MAG42-2130 [uncultured Chthoniobacterales bacterium]